MRRATDFTVPRGSRVHIHQAFRSCPYAGMITSRIHDYAERNGCVVVTDPAEADVHVINSCGSDSSQSALTYEAIAHLGGLARPIVVTGCLNAIEPKKVAAALAPSPHHAMFDPQNLDALDGVFPHDEVLFDAVHPSLKNQYSGTDFATAWYHVGVSTGCLGTCSFCAIRYATGRPRSTPIPAVLADVERGLADGHADVLLVSTDISAWGVDLGASVVDLLRALADHPSRALFSGESFEPKLFLAHLDALLPVFATGRFSVISLPIQSGAQRILDQMRREYAIDAVRRAVDRVRAVAPHIVLRTDVIYGFGDETEAEFGASIEASRMFDIPSFNHYQERPGTAKATLPAEVVAARRDRVADELRARAGRGLPQVRRADGSPYLMASSNSPKPDGYEAWRAALAERLQHLFARGVPMPEGWSVAAPRADADGHAVVLRASHTTGAAFELGLRHPNQRGQYLHVGERVAAFVLGGGFEPHRAGAGQALKALLRIASAA